MNKGSLRRKPESRQEDCGKENMCRNKERMKQESVFLLRSSAPTHLGCCRTRRIREKVREFYQRGIKLSYESLRLSSSRSNEAKEDVTGVVFVGSCVLDPHASCIGLRVIS